MCIGPTCVYMRMHVSNIRVCVMCLSVISVYAWYRTCVSVSTGPTLLGRAGQVRGRFSGGGLMTYLPPVSGHTRRVIVSPPIVIQASD